jgi:DNA polymerase-3 subunit gamma/tau
MIRRPPRSTQPTTLFPYTTLFRSLLSAIGGSDARALVDGIQRLDARAPDYSALLSELAAHLQRIAVLQLLPEARSEDDDTELVELAARLKAEDVQLCYQIAVMGRRDLPWAPDPRSGFEMTLLRMLAFRPEDGGNAARSGTAGTTAAAPPAPVARATAAPAALAATAAARERIDAASDARPSGAVAPAAASSLPWSERIDTLGLDGAARQLARQCAWVGESEGLIRLRLAPGAGFLMQESRRAAIEQALAAQTGSTLRLTIEVAAEGPPEEPTGPLSPAQQDQQKMVARQKAAEAAIEQDPVVRAFKEQFGASVRPGSIQPNN